MNGAHMRNILAVLGKKLAILLLASLITLLLLAILIGSFYLKWFPASTIRETIIGIIVAYSMFVYQWLITYYISPLKNWLTKLEISALKKWAPLNKIKNILTYTFPTVTDGLLKIIPIIVIIFLLTINLSAYNLGPATLDEILGGVVGAWALEIFFFEFKINDTLWLENRDTNVTNFYDSLNDLNKANFEELYKQPEYLNRGNLSESEYYIIANLPSGQPLHIAADGSYNGSLPRITEEDSKKIVKLKSNKCKGSERWFKGFISMKRRIQGHLLFAAGTTISISMLMFDKNMWSHQEILEPFFDAILPKFDDDTYESIVNKIRNSTEMAQKTLDLGEHDVLLDKALVLSGEAIGSWFITELSFFSAWRSIETMAKRYYNIQNRNSLTLKELNDNWNKNGTLRQTYIKKVLRQNNISTRIITDANIKVYQKLRNYIGHGSVDFNLNYRMSKQEDVKFAQLGKKTIKVIKLSRQLIFKTIEQMSKSNKS